jgi:hypothetical protein
MYESIGPNTPSKYIKLIYNKYEKSKYDQLYVIQQQIKIKNMLLEYLYYLNTYVEEYEEITTFDINGLRQQVKYLDEYIKRKNNTMRLDLEGNQIFYETDIKNKLVSIGFERYIQNTGLFAEDLINLVGY